MASFFGIEVRSKEEKEQDFAEYSNRIFPYGEAQRNCIGQLLHELIPREDRQCLMVYYVSIKDEMTKKTGKSFEAAVEAQRRTGIVRITPELIAGVRAVIMADQEVGEDLNYPTAMELKEQCTRNT